MPSTSTRRGVSGASGMPNSIHDMSGAPDASGSGATVRCTRPAPAPGWKSRLASLERRLNRRTTSPTARRWLLIVSLIAFVAIAVMSYLALPDGQTFNWWMAPVLMLVCTPLTVLANAAEFKVMAKFSGRPFGWIASCRLTLDRHRSQPAAAARAGIMIRTQALRAEGATYKRALGANAIAGGAWVAVGAVATGALILSYQGFGLIGTGAVLVGAAGDGHRDLPDAARAPRRLPADVRASSRWSR